MSQAASNRSSPIEGKPAKRKSSSRGLPTNIYNNFAFEFCNAIFWQSLGSPLLLFIRQSGGSATIIGFTSALPLILMPLTIAGSGLVEKLGYRKVAVGCWTLRWMFCVSLIPLALINAPGFEAWRVSLSISVLFLYHLTRNFGVSAWTPWMTGIIPAHLRGLYLSRVTLFANLSSILTFLSVGLILGDNPNLSQFAIVFSIAVTGGFCSSIFMTRVTPPPATRYPPPNPRDRSPATRHLPKRTFWQSLKRCFAQKGFPTFTIIQTFYGVAFFGIPSLSLIYLREKLSISPSFIMYFAMGSTIAATIAANFWGRWIDRRQSTLSLQTLAFGGLCFNSVLWLVLGGLPPFVAPFLAIMVLCLSAIWINALTLSQSHAIMALAPDDDRVMFQNVATLITYCSQALAPSIWGFILDLLQQFRLDLGFYQVGNYQVFYFSSLLIGLVGFAFLLKILFDQKQSLVS